MIDKIIKTYENLNGLLNHKFNDAKTREYIRLQLQNELPNCGIKCDEENNSPEIIEKCVAVARVQWINGAMEINYVDLIFGSPEQIKAIQQ
ncbi:MAG: hypothetical protein JW866_00120 [Ignavibacteriales bacterium]|nr:hypothetical protein [Ignavibacteriales bacterium]